MKKVRFGAIGASLFACWLLLLLSACSSGPTTPLVASPVPTPTPTATQSPVKAGTLLYQANWSHDLDGWVGSGWNVNQGQIATMGRGTFTIISPYRPIVHNYAIEVDIQVSKLFLPVGGYFSIFARRAPGQDGFQAGVSRFIGPGPQPNGTHPEVRILTDPGSSMSQGDGYPRDYEPRDIWHTYRIEVRDMQASFLVDGSEVSTTTSNATPMLSTGPIGITGSDAIITAKDFRVIAL